MFNTIDISETHGAPSRVGKRWLVTLAVPGVGGKGNKYSEAALRESGPTAFPPGTKAFFKHSAPQDRDPRDMVGTYKDGAFWNDTEGKLQAYLTPFPRYASVLEEAGTAIEASIHAKALTDARGDVHQLLYDRANSVDLVAFGGLEGSGLQYQVESLFSAVAAEESISDEDHSQEQQKGMNVDITKEMWEALVADVASVGTKFDTFISESRTELQGVADDAAVEAAVSARLVDAHEAYLAQESAINAADILEPQAVELKGRALKGEDISESLTDAVALAVAAKAQYAPQTPVGGRVVTMTESSSSSQETPRLSGWSRK
jgi:hypothetical protein